jgi:hypothetical protein
VLCVLCAHFFHLFSLSGYIRIMSLLSYPCCDSEYCLNRDAQFEIGHTQDFIARDPARLEIVVVFRGTFSLKDAVTGAWFTFWFQFFPFTFSPPSPPRSFPVSLNPALAHELNK